MTERRTGILAIVVGAAFCCASAPAQVFVDADTPAVPGAQDGTSWDTAYRTLQDGLSNVVAGQEIWVADGVYYPDEDTSGDSGMRSRSFAMVAGVSIFGGFAGGESLRDARDPDRNLAILSGDIDQDDLQRPIATHAETQAGDGNNSYRVVDMSACAGLETIDGFVITAGRADSMPLFGDGAGVYCNRNGRIKNCRITGNYAANNGGGLFIEGTRSFVANCRVNGNVAGVAGGAVYASGGRVRFFNCAFRGNRAALGGGICLGNADFKLINCAVSGNTGTFGGGGFHMDDGRLVVANSTLTGNYSGGFGGAVRVNAARGKPTFRNCIIWNNHGGGSTTGTQASFYFSDLREAPKITNCLVANSGGSAGWNGSAGSDGGFNLDVDPLFVFPHSPSPAPGEEGAFTVSASSPVIDAGLEIYLLEDSADLDADADTGEYVPIDLNGNARVVGDEIDLGAYEFDPALLLDSDGDGLSDQFELTHTGNPVIMPAMSDEDGDCNTALGEFLHGSDPTVGGEKPVTCMGTMESLGDTYLTLTFDVDPEALNFVTYTVLRRCESSFPLGWMEDETVEISSMPSPDDPSLLEVTHRSLFPIDSERVEWLRVRHDVISAGGP